MTPHTTSDDFAYAASIVARDTAAAHARHDAERCTATYYAMEDLARLDAALRGPLPEAHRRMIEREAMRIREAMMPTAMAAE